jgi:hypothetical protein
MSSHLRFLKVVRLAHRYLGIFASPALIFFAFTGAVQTFSLHETTKGSDYKPPRILVILGQIHKKQTPVVGGKAPAPVKVERKTDGADGAAKADRPMDTVSAAVATPKIAPAPEGPKHSPWPLKWFFLLVAVSLFISTVSGIYMSYRFTREKWVVTVLLVLGTVIPVAMVLV